MKLSNAYFANSHHKFPPPRKGAMLSYTFLKLALPAKAAA